MDENMTCLNNLNKQILSLDLKSAGATAACMLEGSFTPHSECRNSRRGITDFDSSKVHSFENITFLSRLQRQKTWGNVPWHFKTLKLRTWPWPVYHVTLQLSPSINCIYTTESIYFSEEQEMCQELFHLPTTLAGGDQCSWQSSVLFWSPWTNATVCRCSLSVSRISVHVFHEKKKESFYVDANKQNYIRWNI